MPESSTQSSSDTYESGIKVRHECLLYVLDEYFHPRVICSDHGSSCSRIEDTMRFLGRNLMWEEENMDVSDYPDVLAHKRDHEHILRQLRAMKDTLECSRYDNSHVANLIKKWARDHADNFDRPFANFLQQRTKY